MVKRIIMLCAAGLSAAFISTAVSAHSDIGVFFGFPGPVIEPPPPVVYEAPPIVYEAPPVVYEAPPVVYETPGVIYAPAPAGYEATYDGGYWGHPYERRDGGWHRGWRHRDDNDDDED